MLEGCWTLITTLSVGNERDGYSKVRTWRQCFDGRGRGRQTAVLEDGKRCEGPLAAGFDQAGVLRVTEPEACTGTALRVGRSQRLCRRRSDAEAVCDGRNLEGGAESLYSGRFRR